MPSGAPELGFGKNFRRLMPETARRGGHPPGPGRYAPSANDALKTDPKIGRAEVLRRAMSGIDRDELGLLQPPLFRVSVPVPSPIRLSSHLNCEPPGWMRTARK